MKKFKAFFFFLFLLLGFIARLYRIDNPVADWHSWRQADTSAVSRNFIKYGFDILHPRFDDLSNVASGLDNPNGYRFVEFPIYNFLQSAFFKVFGIFSLEVWGRLVSAISSIFSAIFIYLIFKKYLNEFGGFLSALFFLFLPFSIYYSRVILPEPLTIMTILGGIYFFDRWGEKVNSEPKTKSSFSCYLWSVVFFAAAILLKPYSLFFSLPIVYLAFKYFGARAFKRIDLWLFLLFALLPFILWRIWMLRFPEGIPAYSWLFNDGGIRFKGSFFYWIFAERLSRLILGYFGIALFFLGFMKLKEEKNYLFSLAFLLSSLIYLFTIAAGNVRHDYYQALIIPSVSLFLARGSLFLFSSERENKIISRTLFFIIILGMLAFSWYYVRDYFNVNNWDIVAAGKKADEVLPKNAKVIALYNGDTSFLYQTNRQGWPVFEKSIEELINMGAQYLIIATPTKNDFSGFGKTYKLVASSSSYLILKLK